RGARASSEDPPENGGIVSMALDRVPFDPAEIGFEFSTEEIAAREQQIEVKAAIQNGRYYEYKKKGYLKLPDKAA
ncbi:MAG TPA: hypothetical protein VK493_12325, partial [Bryobacteraceae bacterium]|nr:hypothetical protein [Bryobacteraceae bacterium]